MTIFEEWNTIKMNQASGYFSFPLTIMSHKKQKNKKKLCWCLFSVMWQGFSKFVYIWGKKKNDKNSHQSFFFPSKPAFLNDFEDSPHALVAHYKLSAAIETKAKTSVCFRNSCFRLCKECEKFTDIATGTKPGLAYTDPDCTYRGLA